MNQITHILKGSGTLGSLLVLASAAGCAPSLIVGPLTHQQEERDHLLNRARQAGMSTDLLDRVLPPLTPEEKNVADEQDHSCRSSYLRKDGFTWTGSGLVAAAAGLMIGGAYATSNNDMTGMPIFGLSAGTNGGSRQQARGHRRHHSAALHRPRLYDQGLREMMQIQEGDRR
jgi:hypothetical protein